MVRRKTSLMKHLLFVTVLSLLLLSCEKINYDIPEGITGNWEWTGSCGGFTGACWYPSDNYKISVEFTRSGKYIRTENGLCVIKTGFSFGDTYYSGDLAIYSLKFSEDWSTTIWFPDSNTLDIVGGDFVEEFRRVR